MLNHGRIQRFQGGGGGYNNFWYKYVNMKTKVSFFTSETIDSLN